MTYRASKHARLSILQKGLIIISIPLVFELFFVFVLIHLLDEAGEHIASEIHSQDKIVAVETLLKEIADSTCSAILYNASRQDELKERNEKSRAKLRKTYSKLVRLCAGDPDELNSAQRLFDSSGVWMEQQDRALESDPQERMSAFFSFKEAGRMQQLLIMRPEGAARVILDKEQRELTVQPKLRQQAIVRMQILIFFSLAVHISLTLFLFNFFFRYLLKGIDNALNNTIKLGLRQELDPPLRGTDEIADLDHALHETANEILEFERFKEQLVGVVSHELRTPLTSVQGTLTLVESGALGDYPPKAMAEIQRAQVSVKQLVDLINNLLLLERLEAGSQVIKHLEFDAAQLILDVLDSREPTALERGAAFECDLEELPMTGDWEKLTQAFEILLDTCIARSPEGGIVTVLAGSVNHDQIEIQIVDQGAPLSAVRSNEYFERTREIDPNEVNKSQVLYLALCQAIIKAHGGSITVSSDESTTCFTVRLSARGQTDA